jgi:hypothetical protein
MRLGQLTAATVLALLAPVAARAQHGGHAPPPPPLVGHFAAGPISRLPPREAATWRAGYWWHGWRAGRVGWWWCAGGYWYWYASPIYPYPADVPADFVGGGYPAPTVWWFCDNPPGYYPYVRGCWRWRPVTPSSEPDYPPPP